MKGTIFVKPIEYNIVIEGERWRQGQNIQGQVILKNHSSEPVVIENLKVRLANGNFKKIKAKDPKGWTVLSEILLSNKISLDCSTVQEFAWSFTLEEDCPITDKNGSLYLTLWDQNNVWPLGQLELGIEPKLVMLQFLEIFQNFLRFKVLQTKYANGMVEIKLQPPSSREHSHIESLIVRMREVNKVLDIEYNFNLQVFETVAGSMAVQKKSKSITQQLTSKQYYVYGDSPNHEYIKSSIETIIKEAAPRIFVS